MTSGRFRHFCVLLDSGGVNVDALDENGRTPLVLACYIPGSSAGAAMVRKLHQHGADLSKRDYNGKTVLHHAVLRHHLPIIRYLLDVNGLDLNPRDNEGNTPLHLIIHNQDFRLLQKFVSCMNLYCIKSDLRNKEGLTPLLLACKMGRIDIARYLSKYARHSPMATDHKTIRNGRTWLETILFVPFELDPFNCPEQDILTIFPKPIDYIPKDCTDNLITYDWHIVVCGGVKEAGKALRRPRTAPTSFKAVLYPKTTASFSYTISLKSSRPASSVPSYISASSPSSNRTTSSRPKNRHTLPTSFSTGSAPSASSYQTLPGFSCLELLPRFLALKATSEGCLPAAVELPEEEPTPSELDVLDGDERVDSQTPSKMGRQSSISDLKSNSKKSKSGEKSKQKMENIAATTNSINKLAPSRRRKSNIPC